MALMPLGYLKAVVSLGVPSADAEFTHNGTGFLFHHPLRTAGNRTQYLTFLVTNRHVVEAGVSHVRFNRVTDDEVRILPIEELTPPGTAGSWSNHPTEDVVVRPLLGTGPLMEGRDFIRPEVFLGDVGAPTEEEAQHIVEGNGVLVLGFPLGLVGDARNYPIVRHGVIARIQDWLRGEASTFLIDSSAFPGSSGGPVIVKPEATAVKGTTATTHALLIGVVSGYIPYRDLAVSTQTKTVRITFEENSGLAEVVPVRTITETITLAIARSDDEGFRWRPHVGPNR
ncbi:MAG: hypothetical protein OXH08_13305 [Gammaproteobacteria bacterium]|nr:hypothetical protein [Gammaproteobacteria bacterium]